jgi:uncharacterized membrane protein YkgB
LLSIPSPRVHQSSDRRPNSYFLGVSEWTFGTSLLAGFWDKRLGVLGALGSTGTFIAAVTIIPFLPEGWDVARELPAMTGNVPFLMKDVVLLAGDCLGGGLSPGDRSAFSRDTQTARLGR